MSRRHLSDTAYFALLKSIQRVGGVDCQDHPELFYPEDIEDPDKRAASTKAAKAICAVCPVQSDCFEYALNTNQRFGIWGGTEGSER
jgi:WhiB family redox-sensing transcriptional regulator